MLDLPLLIKEMATRVNDKFAKAIDAEVLIHGDAHPAVARAHTNYGEWLLNEGDVGTTSSRRFGF